VVSGDVAAHQLGIVPGSVEPVSLDMQILISRISKFVISRISKLKSSGSWIHRRYAASSSPGNKCCWAWVVSGDVTAHQLDIVPSSVEPVSLNMHADFEIRDFSDFENLV